LWVRRLGSLRVFPVLCMVCRCVVCSPFPWIFFLKITEFSQTCYSSLFCLSLDSLTSPTVPFQKHGTLELILGRPWVPDFFPFSCEVFKSGRVQTTLTVPPLISFHGDDALLGFPFLSRHEVLAFVSSVFNFFPSCPVPPLVVLTTLSCLPGLSWWKTAAASLQPILPLCSFFFPELGLEALILPHPSLYLVSYLFVGFLDLFRTVFKSFSRCPASTSGKLSTNAP